MGNSYLQVDQWIGARAQKFRNEELKLTQAELADKVGVSRVSIARFELGLQHSTKIFDYLLSAGFEPYTAMEG